jgi:AcrR family transcriptional regulator
MMPRESSPPAQPPGGVTGDDLLAAGLRVLRDEGPAALRVRRVAAAAGCSTMGVYTWFGGKDGLVEAMWLDGFQGLGRALNAVAAAGPPRRRIARLTGAYRDWALAHPTQYQLMFGRAVPEFEPGPELLTEAASGTFSILVEAVTAAQSSGELRPDTPGQLALYVWGLAHGLVMIELSGVVPPQAQGDPGRAYRLAIDALLAGLKR